ncbi:hypothetical protein PF003_g14898 [Phytophthora fragariae]|nr:hypothetical protein PF003_g14898 [Phytophthora fragariae]
MLLPVASWSCWCIFAPSYFKMLCCCAMCTRLTRCGNTLCSTPTCSMLLLLT